MEKASMKPAKHTARIAAFAAVGGIVLASRHPRNMGAATFLAIVHGLIAPPGLAVLTSTVTRMAPAGLAGIALVIYLMAVTGGLVLFILHLQKKHLPPALILLHATAAISATVVLITSQIKGSIKKEGKFRSGFIEQRNHNR